MLRSAAATPSLTSLASGLSSLPIAEPTARKRHAPQGTGGAPGAVGPGVSAGDQHRSGSSAPVPLGDGRLDRGARSTLHADAVIAVAGDRVDVTETLHVLVDGVADRGEDIDDGAGGFARGVVGGGNRLIVLVPACVDLVDRGG